MPKKIWMSWSSGKDSAFALCEIQKAREFEITGLLTTVTESFGRVSMHAVREELLELQAEALGIPLHRVKIPASCTNAIYESRMGEAIERAKAEGIECMGFGDLFLQDIRKYREEKLAGTGIRPLFPLWERPTPALAQAMIASGLKAVITCVDPRKLPASFCGRRFDADFVASLPDGVDPCGENGEFHTFVYDAPAFSRPISIEIGETVERDGFVFTDVMSSSSNEFSSSS